MRADWSFRDDMYGEPSSDPARFTLIERRDLINADIGYQPADGDWSSETRFDVTWQKLRPPRRFSEEAMASSWQFVKNSF